MAETKLAELIRVRESEQGAFGIFEIDDFQFYCFFLMPDSKDLERFHIPDGVYVCKRFNGWKWKNTFEIVREGTDGVDGHKHLLFHSGNIEKHSLGCVLLGETISKLSGERAVLNSGATFQKFLHYTKDLEYFKLLITTISYQGRC
jgi:hypothetical protein